MKKLITFLLLGLFLTLGCTKEKPETEQVTFKVNVSAFDIQENSFKGKTISPFDEFEHQYPTNSSITFTSTNTLPGNTYAYTTGDSTIQTCLFTLPIGEYNVTGNGGNYCYLGKPQIKYTIAEQNIEITNTTTHINLILTPNCTCIILYDQYSLLAIRNIVYQWNVANCGFWKQNNLYYTYIRPATTDYYLFLKKKNNSTFECATSIFKIGYKYHITVNSEGMPINPTPNFEDGTDITF